MLTANATAGRRSANTIEDGFLQQVSTEYVRVQNFIGEVRKGRETKATATFFEIPGSMIRSILARAEANYVVAFDNDQWRVERTRVNAGEKELSPLDARGVRLSAPGDPEP